MSAHSALLYDDDAAFVAGVAPFLREGIERDEAVLANFHPRKLGLLREELGDDAKHVAFNDMQDVGSNPARLSALWFGFVIEQASLARRFRGAGEPVHAGRRGAELEEALLHEALLNHPVPGSDLGLVLCPFDVSALDDRTIRAAAATHSQVLGGEGPAAHDSRHAEAVFRRPLDAPPSDAAVLRYDVHALPQARDLVGRCAAEAGLGPERTDDLVLSVNELATNSIRYGGGTGTLHLWTTPEGVHAQVSDVGVIDSMLAGRVPPPPEPVNGRGLWIINQLCDLVQLRSAPSFGTTVRITQRRR